jgi:hypothetical protein
MLGQHYRGVREFKHTFLPRLKIIVFYQIESRYTFLENEALGTAKYK